MNSNKDDPQIDDPSTDDIEEPGPQSDLNDNASTHQLENKISNSIADDSQGFFKLGIGFEFGLIVLALVLGWFGICDPSQSLTDLDLVTRLQPAFVWGMIAMIPMLTLLWASLNVDIGLFQSLRKTVEEHLYPVLRDLTLWQVGLLSLLAGLGEELLFRWSLQGALSEYFTFEQGSYLAAILVGILFGVCHFITPAYALITAAIGIYLGFLMIWSGTYLAPAIAHALYDFVALLVIVKLARRKKILDDELAEAPSSESTAAITAI